MYHRVSPTGKASSRRWRITPEELDDQLRALRRAGYTGISLAELWAAWYEGGRLPRRPVVLTFDDGFADFAEHAWPRLRTAGWGATVFVVTDAVGGRNTWDDVYDEQVPLMEWSTLKRLASEGLDLGSHSADHPALTALTPDRARRQVEASRERLEAELGVAPRSFAYPFGDFDDAVVAVVAAAGYDFGVTCTPGSVTGRAEPLLLPRFEVLGAMSGRSLVGELVRLRG
jgi:peptidoglycan/xylan/chitin deacetylase (PgdA/CDA1 family)